MRLPGSSSAMNRQTGALHRNTFRLALIFAGGAAFGSIATKLIGLEYASWIIIALCWPLAMIFAMFDRGRGQEASQAPVRQGGKPNPPPRRPANRGSDRLHRIK